MGLSHTETRGAGTCGSANAPTDAIPEAGTGDSARSHVPTSIACGARQG